MKRVLVVESQPLMRAAIVRLVQEAWPKIRIAEAADLAGIESACRSPVSLVIMDPQLPDAVGLASLVFVQRAAPNAPVVVFSARQDDRLIASSDALGATGYVHKSAAVEVVVQTLKAASTGARCFPSLQGAISAEKSLETMRQRLTSLTATQMKVLMGIADGRLNKQVAADLDVSEAAVKAHMTAIFRKLGVHNRTQALMALNPVLDTRQSA